MISSELKKQIEDRLKNAFKPELLEVVDEGYLHEGHEGARDGRGHFRVRIAASSFASVAPLKRHRLIYQALGELMRDEIHALAIEATIPT